MGKQKEVILTAQKGVQVKTAIFDVSGSKWVNGFSFCVGGANGGELTTVFVFLNLFIESLPFNFFTFSLFLILFTRNK